MNTGTRQKLENFRKICAAKGLAFTHQRCVIYLAVTESMEHPTPEAVYRKVKRRIPSVSLATVYKNIRTFLEAGLLREISPLHESQRLDADLHPHHHLVCLRCKSVRDLPAEAVSPVRFRQPLPGGFHPQRTSLEVLGLCARCAAGRQNSDHSLTGG